MRTITLTCVGAALWSTALNKLQVTLRALRRVLRILPAVVQPIARQITPSALAGMSLVAACGGSEPPAPAIASTPPLHALVAPAPDLSYEATPDAGIAHRTPRTRGRFHVTMYYIANENEVDGPPKVARNLPDAAQPASVATTILSATDAAPVDNQANQPALTDLPAETTAEEIELAAAAPIADAAPHRVPAYDRNCEPLAQVSRAFRRQLAMQGTGQLRDGRMLNVATRCKCQPCFHVLPPHRVWGMGGSGLPLEPFRSVAVDPGVVKLGSLLYIPALDGVRMPGPEPIGGFIHDGCVIAADTGGNIDGAQLDLFVARRAYLNGLARRGGSHSWMQSVEVFDGGTRCQRKGGKVSQSAAASI